MRFVSCFGVAMGSSLAAAAPVAPSPLEIQGLQLADGQIATPPTPQIWGQPLSVAQRRRADHRLAGLRAELGRSWISWDPQRDAPNGIITTGVPAPGAVSSPAVAELFARVWLARHLDVLAPGSSTSDFVLVANDLSSGIRTIGFEQQHAGIPVVGGQLSFRFKADALAYVASQALPAVELSGTTAPFAAPELIHETAQAWIADDFPGASPSLPGTDTRLILPIWTGTRWAYHEVIRVSVHASDPLGQWWVYLDARTAAPVAREQKLRPVATVRFDVPERHPNSDRYDALAPELYVTEGGNPATTDLAGTLALTASPTTLDTTVDGPLVDVSNSAGAGLTASFPVADGDTIVWSESGSEYDDAQLSAFVHASLVKAYVREIDPGLTWLDQTIDVTVNIEGSCNAASNGDSVFFLRSSAECQNTARLADVIYHEIGHSVHRQSLIPGVGAFNSPLSEGISDYLASTIVDDSAMGRGFFHTDEPLRELDPVGSEWTWPDDIAEAHFTGRIIGGTLWDLRTSLMGTLGDEAGQDHTDRIWYESIRRAVDIPSMYPEALLYDDDDGDLTNGTPNGCEINAAFEAHGLLDPGALGDASIELRQVPEGRQVALTQELAIFPGCPVDLESARLSWRLRQDPDTVEEHYMIFEDGAWVSTIPTQETGAVVEYQLALTYTNGTETALPINAADTWYQTFFGAVVPIYCLDGDADLGEWSFGGSGNNWSFGPLGEDPGIDPTEPYDGDGVLLSQDGEYQPGSNTQATGPAVDISGFGDVRLHYRRWLTVEDAVFDQATIYGNGQPLWTNLATELSNVHHQDREWRFHDIDLSEFIVDGEVQLSFGLTSDQGLELGGWTVDALCVVEVVEQVCGDGQTTGDELCDDGNTDEGDGCDAECMPEDPEPPTGTTGGAGDSGGVDETGIDDHGPEGGTEGGTEGSTEGSTGGAEQDDEGATTDGCGCTSGSDEPARGAWLLLLVIGGLGRCRRGTSWALGHGANEEPVTHPDVPRRQGPSRGPSRPGHAESIANANQCLACPERRALGSKPA